MCKCNCKRLIDEIDIFGYRGLGTLPFIAIHCLPRVRAANRGITERISASLFIGTDPFIAAIVCRINFTSWRSSMDLIG